MNNENGFFACAVWRNGEYQKGSNLWYEDQEDLSNAISNSWSGCSWFTGETKEEVDEQAFEFMS